MVARRRRRSRAEAAQMVAEYEASGLSREEFCRERELALSTLVRYRKRRRQEQGDAADPGRWVAVELAGSHQAGTRKAASRFVIVCSGRMTCSRALRINPRPKPAIKSVKVH